MGDVTRLSMDGLSVYTQWAARAYDDASRAINRETEAFFERLHTGANKENPLYEYDAENYTRYQVKNKREAESIVSAITKSIEEENKKRSPADAINAKDLIYTPVEVNGKTYIEIPTAAKELMDEYQNTYDTSAREVGRDNVAQITAESEYRGAGSAYTSAVLNGLETLGATISRISAAEVRTANHANDTVQLRVDDSGTIHYFHKDKELTFESNRTVSRNGKLVTQEGRVFRDGNLVHNEKFANALKESVAEQKRILGEELRRRIPMLAATKDATAAYNTAIRLVQNRTGEDSIAKDIMSVFRNQDGKQVAIHHDRAKKVDIENTSRWTLGKVGETAVRLKQMELMGEAVTATAFRKDFGLAETAELTPDVFADCTKTLMERANKAEINLVTKTGNLDVKAMANLTPGQLEKLGISRSTAKEIAGFGDLKNNRLGKTQGMSYKKMGATMLVGKMADDDDTRQAINNARQGTRITKTTVKEMKRTRDAAKYQREANKLKKANQQGDLKDKFRKEKTRTEKKMTEAQMRRQEKYGEKFAKKVKKTEKNMKKNSLSNRVHRSTNKWAKRVSESKAFKPIAWANKMVTAAKKKIAEWIAAAAGHIIVPMIAAVLVVAILFVIQILLNTLTDKVGELFLGKLNAESVDETAFHEIYQILDQEEQHWIRDLNNALSSLYNTEKRTSAKYGTRYLSWDSYIRSKEDLKSYGGTNVVGSIFSDKDGNWLDDEYWTGSRILCGPFNVNLSFDGVYDTKIVTNSNVYSASDPREGYGGRQDLIVAQTGHTSNIKDILAMVDVMYGDIQDDSGMKVLLGKTPNGIKWENFKKRVSNLILFCKLLIFGSDDGEDWRVAYAKQKKLIVDYKTITNYAETLFAASHQMQIELEVQYYEVQSEAVCEANLGTDLGYSAQKKFSQYGMCVTPEEVRLLLAYDTKSGTVRPYIADGKRTFIAYTDEGKFKQDITLSNMASKENPCVWSGMGSNEATYNKIKNSDCWVTEGNPVKSNRLPTHVVSNVTMNVNETFVKGANGKDLVTYTKGNPQTVTLPADYDLEAAKTKLLTETKNAVLQAKNKKEFQTSYVLSADRFTFTKRTYKFPKGEDFKPEVKEEDGTVKEENKLFHLEPYTQSYQRPIYDRYGRQTGVETWYINKLKLVYDGPQITQTVTKYNRKCMGHQFRYCAGHVCAHTTGVVYSITNDQIAAVNTGSLDLQAVNYDAAAGGRGTIVGKINEETLIRTEAPIDDLKASGAAQMPLADAQGTFVGRGRNIYVVNGKWSDGTDDNDQFHVSITGCEYLLQDIFDIDTLIEKGSRVFPIRYAWEYEGWTATNMTLAIGKMSGDWNELYGFDIPISIGGMVCLSEEDITAITDELIASYGDNLTEARLTGITAALRSVGTGVLCEGRQHEHKYLTDAHECFSHDVVVDGVTVRTVHYDASCVGGDMQDYLAYLWGLMGGRWRYDVITGSPWFGGGTPLPGDAIYIAADSSWKLEATGENQMEKMVEKYGDLAYQMPVWMADSPLDEYFLKEAKDRYAEKYLFYIGKLSHPVSTSTGIDLPVGQPIVVEFQRASSADLYGSIYLRFYENNKWERDMDWNPYSDIDIYPSLRYPNESRKAVFIRFTEH